MFAIIVIHVIQQMFKIPIIPFGNKSNKCPKNHEKGVKQSWEEIV